MASLQMSLFAPRWQSRPATVETEQYVDPFLASISPRIEAAAGALLVFDNDTWNNKLNGAICVDVECYRNFFVICVRRLVDGKCLAFEISARTDFRVALRELLLYILNNNTIITFNGNSYDLPMIFYALRNADNAALKAMSDKIILGDLKPWDVGIRVPKLNHIDLMEPNPSVKQGLKMLNGRLHGRYMVDLPYTPDAILTPDQMNITTLYCFNDIEATALLYRSMREPLELRVALGRTYGMDFRSKSDSQIGEAIVKKRVEAITGQRIKKS